MKTTILFLTSLLMTAFMSGCNSSSQHDNNDTAHQYPPLQESVKTVTLPLINESDLK